MSRHHGPGHHLLHSQNTGCKSSQPGQPTQFLQSPRFANQFACALKQTPCPQSTINGWSGAVLSPDMYALVDGKPFKNETGLKTLIPDFPPIFVSNGTTVIPYTHEQMLKITAKFARKKITMTPRATFTAQCTMCLTRTSTMHSKLHPPLYPQQLNGTLQCHSTRFLTSS